jgi:sterol desaturase/sphingolipid hydroxylase (fatty acid hydroxylase superfamily)
MRQFDFTDPAVFFVLTAIFFAILVFRYAFIAGIFHLFFFGFSSPSVGKRRIVKERHDRKQQYKEVFWSLLSSVIFAFAGAGMVVAWQMGYTQVYEDLSRYGLWYLPVSFLIATFIHETYYYWLHRWMHIPVVFRAIHKTHHESRNTSPWTSFSFHPAESLLQAVIVPLTIMVLPMHYWVIVAWLVFMSVTSVINHLNVEIYPRRFNRHWLGKWLIGATHHSLHHTEFKRNFGLYFTFWDHWMGTESENYNEVYERVTEGRGEV